MDRISELFSKLRHRLISKHHFWWLLTAVGLVSIFPLARLIEPTSLAVYKQLLILYAIDSLLFFFTDRINARIGVLTLIFLTTMEVIVTIYYLISLADVTRL